MYWNPILWSLIVHVIEIYETFSQGNLCMSLLPDIAYSATCLCPWYQTLLSRQPLQDNAFKTTFSRYSFQGNLFCSRYQTMLSMQPFLNIPFNATSLSPLYQTMLSRQSFLDIPFKATYFCPWKQTCIEGDL